MQVTGPAKFYVYRAWTDSHHGIQYTLGFFTREDDAREVVNRICGLRGASDPDYGVEKIPVMEIDQSDEKEKK